MSAAAVDPHSPDALASNPKAPMKRAFLSGSAWAFGGYGVQQAIRLAGNLLLTRLLVPEYFGLMALVNLFIQGLEMFADIGIGPSIVQHRRGSDPVFLNTAWSLQVVRGFALWGGCLVLTPIAAGFYHQKELLFLMPVAGFSAVISGFSSTALFTELRRLSLARLTMLEIGAQAVGIAAMSAWAWFCPTIWALVAGSLISAGVRMAASHWLLPGTSNRWHWDRTVASELIRFGRWIFFSTALSFLASQGDRLVLGRFLPMDMLGIYGIALFLAQAALSALQSVSNKVLFPLYSRLTEADPAELRRRLWKYRLLLLGAICPVLVVLTVFGDVVIRIMYDHRYQQAGWMLQVLSAGTIGGVILTTLSPVLLAVGDSFRFMILLLGRSVALLAAMALGGWLGGHVSLFGHAPIGSLPGVVVGVSAASFLVYPLLAWQIRRYGVWRPAFDAAVVAVCAGLIGLGFLIKPAICAWLNQIPHLYRS
jgi:O-antigen/teichoic acid export membrane protein